MTIPWFGFGLADQKWLGNDWLASISSTMIHELALITRSRLTSSALAHREDTISTKMSFTTGQRSGMEYRMWNGTRISAGLISPAEMRLLP